MAEMIVFYFFLSFLSIYGLISVISYIRNLFSDIKVMRGKTVFTVVALKDEEEQVEGIINSLLIKANASDSGVSDQRIIAVDMGSTDGTADIVRRMEREKKGVTLMNINELTENIASSIPIHN